MIDKKRVMDIARVIGFVAYTYGNYEKSGTKKAKIDDKDISIERFANALITADMMSDNPVFENGGKLSLDSDIVKYASEVSGIKFDFPKGMAVRFDENRPEMNLDFQAFYRGAGILIVFKGGEGLKGRYAFYWDDDGMCPVTTLEEELKNSFDMVKQMKKLQENSDLSDNENKEK